MNRLSMHSKRRHFLCCCIKKRHPNNPNGQRGIFQSFCQCPHCISYQRCGDRIGEGGCRFWKRTWGAFYLHCGWCWHRPRRSTISAPMLILGKVLVLSLVACIIVGFAANLGLIVLWGLHPPAICYKSWSRAETNIKTWGFADLLVQHLNTSIMIV